MIPLIYGAREDSWESLGQQEDNQSILKAINTKQSLKRLRLKGKLQYFGHLMQKTNSLEKILKLGNIKGRWRRGWQDEMIRWRHWFNGDEFELTPGDSEGQASLEYCSQWGLPPWGTWLSNWTTIKYICINACVLSSVQSFSCVWLLATPWIEARQASLSITNLHSLLKLMLFESVMPSSHLILCPSLLLLPPIPPSIRVFSNESTLHMRWPKYWSFSLSISPSNEHLGLISFRMGWLDLLAVQGTLMSLLQHHSSKASIFRCSAFFTVQLSHPYMTTGKTIALTRWTFVGKVMSLLCNTLSRLVITFLPRSKCILISWLQSPSAVILELKK